MNVLQMIQSQMPVTRKTAAPKAPKAVKFNALRIGDYDPKKLSIHQEALAKFGKVWSNPNRIFCMAFETPAGALQAPEDILFTLENGNTSVVYLSIGNETAKDKAIAIVAAQNPEMPRIGEEFTALVKAEIEKMPESVQGVSAIGTKVTAVENGTRFNFTCQDVENGDCAAEFLAKIGGDFNVTGFKGFMTNSEGTVIATVGNDETIQEGCIYYGIKPWVPVDFNKLVKNSFLAVVNQPLSAPRPRKTRAVKAKATEQVVATETV